VVAINRDGDGRATGAEIDVDGRRFPVRSAVVINAAGVWADDVRALDEGTHPNSIRPAKGIHVAVPWDKVRNDIAVVIPVPKDKRSLFVVPWGPNPDGTFRHTYVGTTDTDYDGPLDDPQCTAADLAYVLGALNASVTTGITAADVTGTWAGLRPLVKAADSGRTADLSRRHHVGVGTSGVITVTGGKLTTYRAMAQDAVDVAVDQLGKRSRCRTKRRALVGASGFRDRPAGTPAAHLRGRYGALAALIEALIADDPSLGEPLVPGLAYVRAEAIHAVRHEMALDLDDVLGRRTRAVLFDRGACADAAEQVARLIAGELGWDEERIMHETAVFRAEVEHQLTSERAVSAPGAPA
jgi:glycerol-3-phosphate dehydrogenase